MLFTSHRCWPVLSIFTSYTVCCSNVLSIMLICVAALCFLLQLILHIHAQGIMSIFVEDIMNINEQCKFMHIISQYAWAVVMDYYFTVPFLCFNCCSLAFLTEPSIAALTTQSTLAVVNPRRSMTDHCSSIARKRSWVMVFGL